MKKPKKKKIKVRNRLANKAWKMSGAGRHKNRKKEANKNHCRNKQEDQ